MFVREKHINGYTYLYLVESVREDGRAKQRIIKNLGRKDAVIASGELERLAASVGRYTERAIVLSQLQTGDLDGLSCRRIGAPLLFGRLWQDTGCRSVIEDLLATRSFEYPLERAVFVSVLHRIMVSGSDRACEKWMADYDIPGSDGLALLRENPDVGLVLLDLAMPEMDGAEVLRRLRETNATVPVYLMTGFLSADVNMNGATGVFAKPIDIAQVNELLAAVAGTAGPAPGSGTPAP